MSNDKLTVEQKFAKVMLQLRVLRPFYSAVYEVIEKHESGLVPTIGVTTNELLYNKQFCDGVPFNEFIFINLHEIAHIALEHPARCEGRDPKLWNIACDLYCNRMLAVEFGLRPGQTVNVNGIDICMPTNGVYCDTIDIDSEYAEQIYYSLAEQAKKNGYFDDKQSQQLGGSGKPGSPNDSAESNERSKKYQFTYRGTQEGKSWDTVNNVFRASIDTKDEGDIIDNGSEQSLKQQEVDKVISDALVRVEMSSSACGDTPGGLMAIVKKMRKSELDWRKLLRKYLIASTSSDSSFSRPDKRMYYQKSIYPGQVADESNSLKGVKVCIDTSGSISDEDIEYFCGQVWALIKQFKIKAELIYWDASVQSTGEFTGYKEFERVDIFGRGGTDPKVVFDYFDSKKCKVKPVVTLMFTDGYFSTSEITSKQRKKYKDTIWIMTRSHDQNFNPPFGRKAIAKFN